MITLLVAILIFAFSMQDSVASDGVSLSFTRILFEKFFGPEFAENANHFIRKCAHFSIYLAFGFCVRTILYLSNIKFSGRFCAFLSTLICFLYAVSDEIHQYFVPGRSCSFLDVIIDTVGAIFGIIISYFIFKRMKFFKTT